MTAYAALALVGVAVVTLAWTVDRLRRENARLTNLLMSRTTADFTNLQRASALTEATGGRIAQPNRPEPVGPPLGL